MNHALKITTAAAALLLLAACDNDKGAEGAGGDASGATVQTVQANMDVAASLPLNDQTDFEQATRGLIAKDEPLVITKADGTVVWDRPSYDFVTGEAPASVNPSLWRQAQLNNIYGLFEVAEGVYQVRGYDLANMSIIDGPEGRVIVDPLTSVETAQKALALVERELGKKPIVAVIHTHSHIDHFGGIEGIVSAEDVKSGKVKIIAPEGFLEEATSENILAGIAMGRRAAYMYGAQLDRSPQGHIGTGLGKQPAQGTFTLMEPTDIVDHTGQTMTIAGIEFVFQYAPDSEAPAVLTFYLPHVKAFSGADNLTRGMHNLYTLRGAKVRDALKWTAYTDEIIELFGDTEVMFNSHNWPLWGNENFISFLKNQRDMYRFIHDQTLRYANQGYTPREIAEMIKMPEALDKDFSSRSYYGTTKHNAKAVYQHYFGWYDANPSNLDPLPPEEEATRYVDAMGGVEAVIAKGQSAFEAGEFRWVATLMSHAVFADPENAEAKKLLASAYEQLAYQAESAPWRDVYLMGAKELREGKAGGYIDRSAMNGILSHVPASLFFSAMASWIDAEKADGEHIRLAFNFTDIGETHVLELENAVLHHTMGAPTEEVDATINLTRSLWMKVVGGSAEAFDFLGSDSLEVEGSRLTLIKFFRMLDQPEPNFNSVTPSGASLMAWYTGNLLYDILLLVGFLYAAGIFASARFGTAAYGGKFGTRSKGLKLGPKQGWILMEIPALIFFPLFFFMGSNAADPVPLFLLGVWMFHYTNRALVNPMLMRVQPGSQPSFNINVVVIGWVVLVLHGYLNGAFVGGLAPHLHGADWFSDPRFVIGLIVYACGFTLNVWSDKILRDLRPKQPDPNAPRYVIPTKGPFKYVTCPHYLGELTSFLGFSIMTWGLGGVYILAVSAANLVPRARVTHRWYHRTFPDYPKDRKAIIPFIY